MTQVLFDLSFLDALPRPPRWLVADSAPRRRRPLPSLQLAQRLHNEVPGHRRAGARAGAAAGAGTGAREVGLELARELRAEAEEKAAGIYVVAPFRRPLGVLDLSRRARRVTATIARAAPPGSTIGVVTPGSPPETRAVVERGIAWCESRGYRVRLMPGALEQDDWHGGSPEVRARDLQEAFADPEVDAILTMRGGYGSAQVVPLLDFDAIAETPKAFFGLSDITALHAALLARAGLATFYGPSLTMFGDPSPARLTVERFLDVLAGDTTGLVPEDRDRLTVVSIAGGKASGRLVGGCLVDFIYTIGTPWEPDLDGAIFFFEEVGSAPIRIDRALLHLEQIGKLAGVRGIVVGELAGCEWYEYTSSPRSKTLEDVLEGRLGGLGVPVLYGLPLGHGPSLATLPLGVQATVDADARTLTIDEPALSI